MSSPRSTSSITRSPACCNLSPGHIPQDIRVAPDGSAFFVADMLKDGLVVVDGETFKETGFIPTGVGAHGLYPSRDGKRLYVSNRGTHDLAGVRHGEGSVSVIDFATRKVVADLDDSGRRQPRHGQRQRRRPMAVALRPLRRRRLRLQHATTDRSRRSKSAACRTG